MVKKLLLVFALVLAASFVLPVFADDATVMPAGVVRVRFIPTYAFGDKVFGSDGKSSKAGFTMSAINLGASAEYGINDWMTAGIQWAAGANVWSQFKNSDPLAALNGTSDVNGLYDVFCGVKIQLVGPKAPVQNDIFRVAITPAFIIPVPRTFDPSKQYTDYVSNYTYVLSGGLAGSWYAWKASADVDKHAWAFGGRVAADYVINEMFYLNVQAQYKYFLDLKNVYTEAISNTKGTVSNGYELHGEFEPHFALPLPGNSNFSASLPVSYTMWPAKKIDGTEVPDSAGYNFSAGPSISYFFFAGPLPLEVSASYSYPIMGKNTQATNAITAQFKIFYKF